MSTANPYNATLGEIAANIFAHDVEALARPQSGKWAIHIDPDSEWINMFLAVYLATAAYVYDLPESSWHKSATALNYIERLFRVLLQAATDDRWYHRQPGKGDDNINRFVLLPLMEAYLRVRDVLPRDLSAAVMAKISAALNIQYREYGDAGKEHIIYPNMDVYYCLIMRLGYDLTKQSDYLKEYERFMELLEQAQFAEGAWTYVKGTNECPNYHDLVVVVLGRIYAFARDDRARRMLEKSIPYYPGVMLPTGMEEFITDPWFKHQWDEGDSYGPDTVASITGDGRNRWIGDRLRKKYLARVKQKMGSLYLVYAAELWRDVPAQPFAAKGIFYDENVQGPRGKFDEWSWVATGRFGCSTVIGAVAHHPQASNVVGLLGITPEIEGRHGGKPDAYLDRYALGMIPPGTKGVTTIGNGRCTFEVAYQMACFRSMWEAPPFPFKWQCCQRWELGPREIKGRMEVTSLEDQASPPPRVLIRFGKRLKIEELGQGRYAYGPFKLTVLKSDFPTVAVEPIAACGYMIEQDAWQLVLQTPAHSPDYVRGEMFSLEVRLEYLNPT